MCDAISAVPSRTQRALVVTVWSHQGELASTQVTVVQRSLLSQIAWAELDGIGVWRKLHNAAKACGDDEMIRILNEYDWLPE